MIPIVFIGPDKSGSTWLYHVLGSHEHVAQSAVKEVFYFDRYYSRGPTWYRKQFPSSDAATHFLDVSHDYMFSKDVPQRIHRHLGEGTQIVVGVRDPIKRAYSAYRYMQSQGRLSNRMSFGDALAHCEELLAHGNYALTLPSWLEIFRTIELLDFDQMSVDPVAEATRLADNLGLSPSTHLAQAAAGGVRNPARRVRSSAAVRLGRAALWKARDLGVGRPADVVKNSAIIGKLLFSSADPPDQQAILAAQDSYRSDVIRFLEPLRHIDSELWRRYCSPYIEPPHTSVGENV